MNVKRNLGKNFLLIVDKCFPKNHPLNRIFNRITLKLSYCCTPKMKTRIGSHNKSVLSAYTTQTPAEQHDTCNCRRKPEHPLDGKCLQTNVIYQAIVTSTDTTTDSYVGLAANFKERVRNYQSSFWHASKRNETELSKYVWTLKDCKMPDKIKWAMLKKCLPYNLSTFLRNVV